jgi:hypothetical protein
MLQLLSLNIADRLSAVSLAYVSRFCYTYSQSMSVARSRTPSREIKGPQRRYEGRLRFFYAPPSMCGGTFSHPMPGGLSHGSWHCEVV